MKSRRVIIKFISTELWLIRWLPGRRLTWARSPEQAFDKVTDSVKRSVSTDGEGVVMQIEWHNVQPSDFDRIHKLATEVPMR